MSTELDAVNSEVVTCRRCPRLVTWRESVAAEKTRRFADHDYWGKPVPAFGDPHARLLIVGLAPAAHGANRTGRMFTGDRSGDWLYRALHRAGFASQAEATHREDGLFLRDAYITALCRCAPPANKPTTGEFQACRAYLEREAAHFLRSWENGAHHGAVLCLGGLAFAHTLRLLEQLGRGPFRPRPAFAHGAAVAIPPRLRLFGAYHPSQQNTFTGRLTEPMLDAVFGDIATWLAGP